MNSTNLEHLLESLVGMALIGILTGNWLAATLVPIGFFLGREHAQYEYKLIKARGGNREKANLKPWDGFRIWEWSIDSKFDLLFPILGNMAVYLMLVYFFSV